MKSLAAKISFLVVILASVSACKHDNCSGVTCPTDQECYVGSCICANGYQGTNCDTLSYNNWIGNYIVNENCQNFSGYNVHIFWVADTSAPGEIAISSMFGQGTVYAYIYNSGGNIGNNITINAQNLSSVSGIYGTGTRGTNGTIELFLSYSYNGNDYSCTEILTKF